MLGCCVPERLCSPSTVLLFAAVFVRSSRGLQRGKHSADAQPLVSRPPTGWKALWAHLRVGSITQIDAPPRPAHDLRHRRSAARGTWARAMCRTATPTTPSPSTTTSCCWRWAR